MPQVTLHSAGGDALEDLLLNEQVFGAEVRADLVHAAVVAQLAAKRTGTHQAKTRGEVSGGGKKPYRQKGTGRARQGSTRAAQWVGGGVAHPPRPRDYSHRLPRKVRRQALYSAWSEHAAQDTLVVVDQFAFETPRTRLAAEALRALLAPQADRVAATMTPPSADEESTRPVRRARRRQRALLLLPADESLRRAFGNLATIVFDYEDKLTVTYTVRCQTAPYASVYDLTLADVVVTTRAGIERVTAELAGQREASA